MLLTTITNGSACGMGIGSCGGNVDANRDHNIKWVIYANDGWYGNSCCFGKRASILIMLTAKTMMMVFTVAMWMSMNVVTSIAFSF